ncbi:MAG: efflux RND transporter permease subunit, partial [Ignavibacteriota bacterium]
MFEKIISGSVKRRGMVIATVLLLAIAGVYCALNLSIDAVPDITNNQVQVLTNAPTFGPLEIERLITHPIETEMRNIPNVEQIWSISKFGLSSVTIVFKDNVDIYFARQLVHERLSEAQSKIPPGAGEPELGPISTGLGEIYQYIVEGDEYTPMQLKTIQEWVIKPQLLGVEGVAEVNTWGGETRQVQISLRTSELQKYAVSLDDVFHAVEKNNTNAGGAYIEMSGEQYLIRGLGYVQSFDDIKQIV